MVVVAVIGEKPERSPVCRQRHAERLVKFLRAIEIGNGEVHVAGPGPWWETRPFGALSSRKGLQIERQRSHMDAQVRPLPMVGGTVGVHFDPVVLWIGKIKRLAYQVIGGADQGPSVTSGVAQEGSEGDAVLNQDREVKESSCEGRTPAPVRK